MESRSCDRRWDGILRARPAIAAIAALLLAAAPRAGAAEGPGPIAYTIRFPDVDSHLAEVEAVVPTEGLDDIEL
jgi:hypothetical protein